MLVRLRFFIQDNRREVVLVTLFFLVSVISFAAGFNLAGQAGHAQIIIQKNSPAL